MTSADFASAQNRIARRRHERAVALQTEQRRELRMFNQTALSSLPSPLRQAYFSLWSQWNTHTSRQGTNPAFRVGQVDAELLDEELLDLLKNQLEEAFKYYGTSIKNDWQAEIQLALRVVLFKVSIWDNDASYGAALQNLKYTDARAADGIMPEPIKRWQKAAHGILSVGGRYAWGKWNDYLLDAESGYDEPSEGIQLLSKASSIVSATHSAAAFGSFLVFLLDGKYRTLLDRLLRMRLTPTMQHTNREVSFEYLNRQLVWHAFTEFLLFLLPLVGISRWRRWVARAWQRVVAALQAETSRGPVKSTGELSFLPERTCAICYFDQNPTASTEQDVTAISAASSGIIGSASTDVTNPYETEPCGCVYCFVCIAQRLEAEDGEGWTCLRCGEIVKECKPWNGDIVDEQEDRRDTSSVISGRSTKRVTFADDFKGGIQAVDPRPDDDAESVNDDAANDQSFVESVDWSSVGVDHTPPSEAYGTEDEDQDSAAQSALDLSSYSFATAPGGDDEATDR